MKKNIIISNVELEEIYPLRSRVLRPGQAIESCHYKEDSVSGCFHLGAKVGSEVIGIASFYEEPHLSLPANLSYRLRGMAVLEEYRSSGVGKQIINRAIDICKQASADLLWCNARQSAAGFYKKLDFDYHGDSFDLPNIGPHFVMFTKL